MLRLSMCAGLAATAAWLALVTAPTVAHACGGCFAPPDTVTTVNSHRMVISLSPERTLLWDQIQYSGNPKDFVWVLPVPSAAATVEIADPAFFDEIEFQTAPRVQPPGAPPSPCFGCCSASADSAGLADGDDVIVYNESVVGPYETVTIGSQDAGALRAWLLEHGYRVGPDTEPTIMHYADQGSVFVVLRLAPGENVQSMQPVRVSFPGYMATFPLEMVKIGARGLLELSLWVIAEQRYEAYNYENARIDPEELVYDWNTNTSNYGDVFRDTIDRTGGRTWITEAATTLPRYWFTDLEEVERVFTDIPVPFVTRIRTAMLLEHLDEDLILVPAADGTPVSNVLVPGTELDRQIPSPDEGGCAAIETPRSHVLLIGFLLASLAILWRPSRRRRRAPRS